MKFDYCELPGVKTNTIINNNVIYNIIGDRAGAIMNNNVIYNIIGDRTGA